MSSGSKEIARNQIAIFGVDSQEREEIFHFWGSGESYCSRIPYLESFLFRSSMIRVSNDVFERAIISHKRVSNRSSALCPCDWTKAGIKSNLIWLISLKKPTGLITWRLFACRYEIDYQLQRYVISFPFLDSRQLPIKASLFCWPTVHRGGATSWIQIVFTCPESISSDFSEIDRYW